MNKLNIKECPLCGNTEFKHEGSSKDFYASGEHFDLMSCKSCGFKFTQNAPVESEMGAYYDSPDYISHTNIKLGMMNILYHNVRRHMLKRKASLVQREAHYHKGRLLDIGTGTGYFAITMKLRGWKVQAIEKSESARQFALDNFELEVLPDDALNKFAPKSFDVITLWHVMEHIEHLNELWDRLHELLDDKGTLIVAVPNSESYDARQYGENWAAYDVPRHLWHFTPVTMKKFAEKHGFTMRNRLPMPYDAFYVSILSEKNQKKNFSFIRGMWTGTKAAIQSLGKKELSSSLIYIFRKK